MVRRPTSRCRLNPIKLHLGQIERIDEYIDHPNRIALVDRRVQADCAVEIDGNA